MEISGNDVLECAGDVLTLLGHHMLPVDKRKDEWRCFNNE
jgi:hypothetical protein